MALINSTQSLTLDIPPSCIAFCPGKPHYFVVGTYLLHQKSQNFSEEENSNEDPTTKDSDDDAAQKRSGSLILYRLDGDQITHIATEITPDFSILDIQWYPHSTPTATSILAVATSTGQIAFYTLQDPKDDSTAHPTLVLLSTKSICEPETLVLALTWHPTLPQTLGFTLSDGRVGLCDAPPRNDNTTTPPALWNPATPLTWTEVFQHTLEAWMLAFTPQPATNPDESTVQAQTPITLLSGSDDQVLQQTTLHTSTGNPDEPTSPVLNWQDRRAHNAGVTAIIPLAPTLVLTGSYDDHIRLLAVPSQTSTGPRRVQCLAEANLDGGVWRLQVLSSRAEEGRYVILASCMHAGARVVRLQREGDDWGFEVLARFEEHESMNYGSDVQRLPGDEGVGEKGETKVVSVSFYDKRMCLWKF